MPGHAAVPRTPADGLLRRISLATMTAVALAGVGSAVGGAELTRLTLRDRAERRAAQLALSTAARMESLDARQRSLLARELTQSLALTVTVLGPDGAPLVDAPEAPREAVHAVFHPPRSHGEFALPDGRTAVAVESLTPAGGESHTLLVVSPLATPTAERGAVALLVLKLALALAVVGTVAVVVSLVVARDITDDLEAILRKATRMTGGSAEALRPLPVQARDEVGALVAAFNKLQRRFTDELALHRAALARLDEDERRREAMITTLRHELRTPLNAILGFADVLLQGVDGALTPAQHDDVELIARSGQSLLRMVDDVLDLSAMASGRCEPRREPLDLAELARAVVAEARGIARGRGVTLTCEAPARADVYADPVALRRALVNLVVNAVEHAGGEVAVTVATRDRAWAVAVRDNGPGIAQSELRRLFKPFERGRTAEARGAGLGLAITLGLVELHGGTLSAHSAVGAGSTFTVTLPAGMAPLPERPRAEGGA